MTNFEEFEDFSSREGEWIAGIDFPFGQPREPVQHLGWRRSERDPDEGWILDPHLLEQQPI
ncbi:MAG: hypothetical protein M3N00_04025 [Actinomycetota bacterium]|nr:hypothetical protein [Actinomycetota bacterium]